MKFATSAFLLISLVGLFVFSSAQEEAPATSTPAIIGLPAGQTIPAFAARDQFGREQSNETLKGTNGTVLLFFRSADW
ncbi:MAG TPA: hypothetical protein VFK06_11630 [Candidatus Angelobacter sp.]|nr:hypothetical protein [Candidatus Angelobacter sp.]